MYVCMYVPAYTERGVELCCGLKAVWPPETFCWLGDCNRCYRFSAKVSRALQLNRDSARCHGAWVGGRIVSRRGFLFFFFVPLYALFCPFFVRVSLCRIPVTVPLTSFHSLGRNGVHIFSCVSESIHVCVDQHQARRVSEKGFFPLTRLDRLREKKMRVGVWEQAAEQLFIHRFSTRSSHLSHECLLCAALPVCLTPLLVCSCAC